MSGYLARLVDRAVGVPAGAVSPRLGPLFPVGPVARTEEPEPGSFRDLTAGPAAVSDPAPAARRVRAEAGEARAEGARPVPAAEVEPVGCEHAARHRQVAAAAARPAVEQVPAVETGVEIAFPVPATREGAAAPDGENVNVATPVQPVVVPEPAATPPASAVRPRTQADPLLRRAGEPQGATEQAPRIEVRIGRVEVRRPPGPEPVQWPAPVAQERAASSFDRLAVARRYVDRRWS
jgi:hypothetical protein